MKKNRFFAEQMAEILREANATVRVHLQIPSPNTDAEHSTDSDFR